MCYVINDISFKILNGKMVIVTVIIKIINGMSFKFQMYLKSNHLTSNGRIFQLLKGLR